MDTSPKSERFLAVLEAHKGILYKVARTYCPDAEDRKDLLQEILIQLWHAFERYDDQYKYSTWIYRIALNVAISAYRKEFRRQRRAHPLTDGLLNIMAPPNSDSLDEKMDLLQQFIAELKQLDKAILLLYLEEKRHKEIAEIIGITETNVATKIARIKTQLKQKFTHTNA
jgi:RNA polymerase sigma factor (sigma-70 family)